MQYGILMHRVLSQHAPPNIKQYIYISSQRVYNSQQLKDEIRIDSERDNCFTNAFRGA